MSAYRSGERIIILLKRGVILLSIIGIILLGIFIFKVSAGLLLIKEIEVTGNLYLDKEEVMQSAGIKEDINLLSLDLEDIDSRLRQNPWIKEVSLKKHFPYTFMIRVKEAEPRALLSLEGGLFLIDDEGVILQEIREKVYRFLPVINIDPTKNRKGLEESLRLIDALSKSGVLKGSDTVEIGLGPYGLFMKLDGEAIKIGYGDYEEKINRWMELEPELRRRGVEIGYVDLRFKDIIVKPLNITKK